MNENHYKHPIAPTHCTLCPRACGANRANGATGYCNVSNALKVARAALHHWEEPCISGTRGSGTVFFSGCNLRCCYCQNYQISAETFGKKISTVQLAKIFLSLEAQGAHNINLVTPTQWQPWILPAIRLAKENGLSLPIVCNTSGYETLESIAAWGDAIDIWLTDYKYATPALAKELSSAEDYPALADAAIRAMLTRTGKLQYDKEGILQRGVIIRHLVLPNHVADSCAVLDKLASLQEEFPGQFIPSIMSQYTPFHKASEHGIGRRITTYEYRRVMEHATACGLTEGYMQEKSSAKEEYTPIFDGSGV